MVFISFHIFFIDLMSIDYAKHTPFTTLTNYIALENLIYDNTEKISINNLDVFKQTHTKPVSPHFAHFESLY